LFSIIFNILFILTILSLITSCYLLIKRDRFGTKPKVISTIAFLLLVIIIIPLGNLPVNYFKPKLTVQEKARIQENADKLYEIPTTIEGKIKVPLKDIAEDIEPIQELSKITSVLNKTKTITPQQVYDTWMIGYNVSSLNNHEYIFANFSNTGDYIVVTFNEDETEIVQVEYFQKEK
jgi:hypothetical protein